MPGRIMSMVPNKIKLELLKNVPDFILGLHNEKSIIIELTNVCNFRCPLCPTPTLNRKRGIMSLGDFKNILDQLKGIKNTINMNYSGEPFINKDILKMVMYANQNGFKTNISTNGSMLKNYPPEQIMNSGISCLTICLDGGTAATYSMYRVGGNFDSLCSEISRLGKYKHEHGSATKLSIQCLVSKHTEPEMDEIIRLGRLWGVDDIVFKNLCLNFGGVGGVGKEMLPTNPLYIRELVTDYICVLPWAGVIYWNGDLGLCCYDFYGDHVVGNVLTDGFKGVFFSKRLNVLRKKVMRNELLLCRGCEGKTKSGIAKLVVLGDPTK